MGEFWVCLGLEDTSPFLSWAPKKVTSHRLPTGRLQSDLAFVFAYREIEKLEHFTQRSGCLVSLRHLGLLAKWGHCCHVKARQMCLLDGGHPSPHLSINLVHITHSHQPRRDLTDRAPGGANVGLNDSVLLFSHSLAYSWGGGSSLANTCSHWALPKGWVYNHGVHASMQSQRDRTKSKDFLAYQPQPQTWSRGKESLSRDILLPAGREGYPLLFAPQV